MTMLLHHQIYLFSFLTLMGALESALPLSLRRTTLPLAANRITDVNSSCDSENLNVTLAMQSPFKGVLFAKDFAQECKSVGSFSNGVMISLPTSGCGVRLTAYPSDKGDIQMVYTVNLVIQQDRFLRQITDQERVIKCHLRESDFLLKSNALEKTLKNELTGGQIGHRVGRMRDAGWSKELEGKQLEEELNEALAAARAWMEIIPEEVDGRPSGVLQVGETACLSVKSTLPVGISWRVVDCQANDGLGDSSQKLTDGRGCPVDELLMPSFTYGPMRSMALMSHQEAAACFPAFKFPDRDRLHLSCGLQFCRKACPKADCNNESSEFHGNKSLDFSERDILDRLEVFNSIEVVAPDIDDLENGDRAQASDPETYRLTNIPGDRTFCVSPEKMAISFCILGVIFLIAVIIAVCSLLRSRRSGTSVPYHTRSLFSSSSSSGSMIGSKLLLHDSPSPDQGRGLHYGRIL